MDLLDFSDCKLYFEEALPARASLLLDQAAREYGLASAETALLRAHLLAPENLTVLVGLYRYYFYQHRLDDALIVAERAMQLSARLLGLPTDWRALDEARLGAAAANSFGLLRFYLLALKAASVVLLRLGQISASRHRLANSPHSIVAISSAPPDCSKWSIRSSTPMKSSVLPLPLV
jgi:hypothetical protein